MTRTREIIERELEYERGALKNNALSKCMFCSEKEKNDQYTTQGTYVSTKVTCRYGYFDILSNHYMNDSGKANPGDDRCPKIKPLYEKIERLEKELTNLPSLNLNPVDTSQIYKSSKQEYHKKPVTVGATAESLTERGFIFLEDKEWEKAAGYFDNALDLNPKFAPAYIGLLCAELKIKKEEKLTYHTGTLDYLPNYQKALRFADENYKIKIEQYNIIIQNNIEERKQEYNERLYKVWTDAKLKADNDPKSTPEYYRKIADGFCNIKPYKDSKDLMGECFKKANNSIMEKNKEGRDWVIKTVYKI
ncbi:MAG: hypothetical protein LBD23_06120 [Oscillospiraceae bacterium]|jgi:tetratricopeptide (TPR) repeat protein|nr:hypothetical protein [Oscillospiraceae bacterium]